MRQEQALPKRQKVGSQGGDEGLVSSQSAAHTEVEARTGSLAGQEGMDRAKVLSHQATRQNVINLFYFILCIFL